MKRIAVVIAAVTAPLLGCGVARTAVDRASLFSAGPAVTAGSRAAAARGTAAAPGATPAPVAEAGAGTAAATRAGAAVTPGAGTGVLHCRSVNGLPDRRCTPGAAYAKVTQANIGRTICTRGWTATVRPPESYTETLKREQIAEYGYRDKRLHDYEEDHLIPLELGGSPRSVRNLWPEYDGGTIPNPKDKVENALRDAVCAHRVRLAAAQRAIARDWKTAERVLGLTAPHPAPSTPAPATSPPASPKPTPTRTAPSLSCSASVSNSQPADYTTVDVYVSTAAGAGVTTVAHYKTTSNQKSATADSQGRATIAYYISGATKGYRVVVDVTVSRGSATARCSTSFTPA